MIILFNFKSATDHDRRNNDFYRNTVITRIKPGLNGNSTWNIIWLYYFNLKVPRLNPV